MNKTQPQTIIVTFPDKVERKYPHGISSMDVARSISSQLAGSVLVACANGKIQDTQIPLTEDTRLELISWEDPRGKATFWHSSAHLMAEALQDMYPSIKFAIGPPIREGFYYDVDLGESTLDPEDIATLEKKMIELARQKNSFARREVSEGEARGFFQGKSDPYKLELIDGLGEDEITFYQQGNFVDLCAGPHIPHTGHIRSVKILNLAGAYWRGDESRKQLTRIYGISFPKAKLLDQFLSLREEAKKRDHRKLGQQLGLFSFSERAGKGLPLWLPKGATLRQVLEDFLRQCQQEAGYEQVITPHIGAKELYVTSGHYSQYAESAFMPIKTPVEGEEYFLKPMNCPHHCEIYALQSRSYKELPLRIAEFGTVYRYEQSGELHGLTRTRSFTQDDAHIFCRPDQIKEEFKKVIELVLYVLKSLDLEDFKAQISLRDKEKAGKYIGDESGWDAAERHIVEAVREMNLQADIAEGEAAFYGPKLDFLVQDALHRPWQLGTIQVDYNLPVRFDLRYVGSDNQKHHPVMIHRAPFGSLERFIAILLENTEGNLPVWLSPIQVSMLPVSEKFNDYCRSIFNKLARGHGIRCSMDNRDETMGKKIRDSELQKIPFMFVIGEKEEEGNTVSVRKHGEGNLGAFSIDSFIEMFEKALARPSFLKN